MRTCPKTEVPATVRDRTEKRRNGILLHHGVCRPEGIDLAIRPPFPQGSLRSPCGKGGMTESAWMQDTRGLACLWHRPIQTSPFGDGYPESSSSFFDHNRKTVGMGRPQTKQAPQIAAAI